MDAEPTVSNWLGRGAPDAAAHHPHSQLEPPELGTSGCLTLPYGKVHTVVQSFI